jgi:ATP-binding cassette subfamily B protein
MKLADNYRTVLPLLADRSRRLAAGMLFLLLTNLFTFAVPWILKKAVDDLQSGIQVRRLLFFCALIVTAAFLQGSFRFLMRRIIIGLSRDIEYIFRNRLVVHILKLPVSFFGTMRTGDVMARVTSDVEAVRMAIGPGAMHLANTSVTFAVALTSMLLLHPRLTFYAFLPTPAVVLLMYYSARFYHRRFLAVQEQRAWLNTTAQENFSGIRVVKSYNQESFQSQRYSQGSREYMKRNLDLARSLGFFHPLVGMVAGTGTLIVLWAGGRLVIENQITLGTLVAFMGFLSLLIWPTIALGWVVTLVQRGSAALGRINHILLEPEEDSSGAALLAPEGPGLSVEASGLTFTYPGRSEPALKDISFRIRPGEKVALVGRTGAGKSTLLHLVPRLRPLSGGTLLVDGNDARHLSLGNLREHIGFVPQETFLFTLSLEENISFEADKSPSLLSVEEAGRLAQLSGQVDELPDGYRTVVGERGVTLSGGQKQRTAIARALLRQPRLLILDDALSAVDAGTEESILDAVFSLPTHCTVLIVTHRLSAMRRAERILVLHEGRLVESGTHDELLSSPGGFYHNLVERQLLAEELEGEVS